LYVFHTLYVYFNVAFSNDIRKKIAKLCFARVLSGKAIFAGISREQFSQRDIANRENLHKNIHDVDIKYKLNLYYI